MYNKFILCIFVFYKKNDEKYYKENYYIHPKLTKTEISIVITEYSGHNNFKVSPYDGTWEITKFSKDKLRIAIEIENSDGTGRGLIVKKFVKRD